jgi:hypothetical protein
MRRPVRMLLASVLLATSFAAGVAPANAACREPWVATGTDVARGYLTDVSVVDGSSAWAVGSRYDRDNNERFVAAHWDGTTWSPEPLGFSPLYANLFAVEAISASDVWASGVYFDEVDDRTELVMFHFNGVAWSVVDAPIARSQRITDLVAFASDDVWAAGQYFASGEYRPWILHWNGVAWSVVDGVPDPSGEEFLYGIDGTSAGDVWVAGTSSASGDAGAVLFHRDGGGWSRADLPRLPSQPRLHDVAVAASDRAFAVGHGGNGALALALRWNGTAWRKMPVPDGPLSLGGVEASTARDVVAIAGTATGDGLLLRWNGTTWRRMSVPDGTQGSLFEVDHAAGAWFVAGGRGRRTSVLQRCSSIA